MVPMANLFSYEGKRVVVTGGATGIGAALVDLVKELGAAHVTVLDIKEPAADVDRFIEVNLADKDSLDAAVAQLEGPVHVLFSNAGVAARSGVRTCLAVNVAASRRLTDAVLPLIPEGGTVVYTASMAGNGWPGHLEIINELLAIDDWDAFLDAAEASEPAQADVYPFSKALMQVYVMRKSHDTIRQGVRVNSICPAPVDTPLMVDFRKDMGDKVIDWSVDVQGNGRMAVAEDIAPPLAFMGSDASAFINGVNLLVDSGFTAAMTTGQADFSALA
jgi:NAD(P)-dependent dehydrogenase (short-subunit alcohol dehydrogenase family)